MNTYNVCGECGVSPFKCKNYYCSGNPKYKGQPRRATPKPKQGPGKPAHNTRSKIKKDNGRGYSIFFSEE